MLYSVNALEADKLIYSWLPMQTFSSMSGLQLKASVMAGMLTEMSNCEAYQEEIESLISEIDEISFSQGNEKTLVKFNGLVRKVRAL